MWTCPNNNAQLDYGALAIDPKTMLIIAASPLDNALQKKLILEPKHHLATEFLEYHLENIFQHQ